MTQRGFWAPASVRAGELHVGDVILLRQGPNEAWWIVMGVMGPGASGHEKFDTVAGLPHAYAELQPGEVIVIARNTRQDDTYHRYQSFDLAVIQAPDSRYESAQPSQ